MTCRELADFLLDYDAGALPPDVYARFEHHLSICPNCRTYLATYRATLALGRHAFADLDAGLPREVPAELVSAILNAIQR